ncbi:unnamed protein product, partial [Acanthocheilonema viteae]
MDGGNDATDALSQLSTEQIEQFRKYFNTFDKENKGFIRATQIGQILRTMGQAFEERDLKKLIKEFDTDGSGEIEFEEFAAMVATFVVEDEKAGIEEELREAFRLYDKEGNGYIAVSDLRDILRALDENISVEELDEMIADIDTDGSGTVDFDECYGFRKQKERAIKTFNYESQQRSGTMQLMLLRQKFSLMDRVEVKTAGCPLISWKAREMLRTATRLKYSAGRPSIGLALFGCKNRPAYRIVVFPDKAYGRHHEGSIIEE